MIVAPASRNSSGETLLTVACVPTGMKMGVRMLPCGVLIVPARAQLWGHSASIVNENGDMRSRWIPLLRGTLEYFLQLVLYHAYASVGSAFVEWLFERLGGFWFVPFCLLVSTVIGGFPSALLSVLLSNR